MSLYDTYLMKISLLLYDPDFPHRSWLRKGADIVHSICNVSVKENERVALFATDVFKALGIKAEPVIFYTPDEEDGRRNK